MLLAVHPRLPRLAAVYGQEHPLHPINSMKGNAMLETITNHIRSAAKAYVAAATPIIATAVADLVTELNSAVAGLITVALTGLAVYLVPNRDA